VADGGRTAPAKHARRECGAISPTWKNAEGAKSGEGMAVTWAAKVNKTTMTIVLYAGSRP